MKTNDMNPRCFSFIKKPDRVMTSALILSVLSFLLMGCARTLPGFAQWYSDAVYTVLKNTIARFSCLFPFSLSEAGLYLLLAVCLYEIFRCFKHPLLLLKNAFFLASLLFFIYTANCGINYYRTPFSEEAGYSEELKKGSTVKELYALCEYLVKQVNETVPEKEAPKRNASFFHSMGKLGQEAMEGLGEDFPQFSGWYPYPKPLFNPRLLSVQQLTGIYSPFTIEANYNSEMPFYNIPHTICHELSHLKGYMREDEANFIGYLACIGSDSEPFQYSGYLTGWVYAGNALAEADFEGYCRLYEQLDSRAIRDLGENNRFWDRFEGAVAEVSTKVNDTYLKAHSQTDGVKSYGRMVDLMLVYYRSHSEAGKPRNNTG